MQRLVVLLLLAWQTFPSNGYAQEGREYEIAFVAERDGRRGVFVMRPDGSEVRSLTDAGQPFLTTSSWSPDGRNILFFAQRPGDLSAHENGALYVMDASGGSQRVLIGGAFLMPPLAAFQFRWSPTGDQVVLPSAYETYEPPTRPSELALYVFGLEAQGPRRLTALGNEDGDPDWSPDGKKIAFSSRREGNRDIYVIDATGENLRRLTSGQRADVGPVWSPDGESIAFVSAGFDGRDLIVMDADGRTQQVLGTAIGEGPSWSPDSQQLVYGCAETVPTSAETGRRATGLDLCIVRLEDGAPVRLNVGPGAQGVVLSPDGARVIYRLIKERSIYSTDLAGEHRLRLTENGLEVLAFAVSPARPGPVERQP